jgi:glutaredoxin
MILKTTKNLLIYGLILVTGLALGHYTPRLVRMLTPDYSEGNFSAYYPDAKVKVALYGTETCPYCAQAREYLRKRQIAFVDLDINNSEKGRRDFSALGGKGVPLILIGSRQMNGFYPAAIDAALGKIKPEEK